MSPAAIPTRPNAAVLLSTLAACLALAVNEPGYGQSVTESRDVTTEIRVYPVHDLLRVPVAYDYPFQSNVHPPDELPTAETGSIGGDWTQNQSTQTRSERLA